MTKGLGVLRNNADMVLSGFFVFVAFVFGVFFVGFDKPYFAPALVLVALTSMIALIPGIWRGWNFPVAPPALALLAFWGWLGLTLLISKVPSVSMIFFVTIGALPLMFFSLTQSPRAQDFIRAGRIAIIVATSLMSIWALVQFFFFSDLVGSRVRHPMLNPNNLAVTLAMGVFMMLPGITAKRRAVQFLSVGLVVLSVFAILTTQSRGGSLGLIVGACLYCVLCFDSIRANKAIFAVLGLGILLSFAIYLPIVSSRIDYGIHLIGGADAAASAHARTYLWKSGLAMMLESPVFGSGLGTFYLTFPRFRDVADLSDGYFLHLDPMQFGIETGWMATILFYAFGTAVLIYTIRALSNTASQGLARVEIVCGFAGLIGLLINAHLDYDLYMLPSEMMAAYLLAAWYLGAEKILGPSHILLNIKNSAHATFLVPLFLIMLVAAPVWIVRTGVAVYYGGISSAGLAVNDIDTARENSERALAWAPKNYDRAYYMDALWRGAVLQKMFLQLSASDRADLFESAQKRLRQTLRYNPYNIHAMNTQAVLYFLSYPRMNPDGVERAREILEQAMEIDPINFNLRMGLSKTLETEGRLQEAVAVLEDGLRYDLTQRYVPTQYFMMITDQKRKLGDVTAANFYANRAVQRNNEALEDAKTRDVFERWLNGKSNELRERLRGGLLGR